MGTGKPNVTMRLYAPQEQCLEKTSIGCHDPPRRGAARHDRCVTNTPSAGPDSADGHRAVEGDKAERHEPSGFRRSTVAWPQLLRRHVGGASARDPVKILIIQGPAILPGLMTARSFGTDGALAADDASHLVGRCRSKQLRPRVGPCRRVACAVIQGHLFPCSNCALWTRYSDGPVAQSAP